MKRGELKEVLDDYERLIPAQWRRVQNDFVREDESQSWLQIISFNASQWSSEYNPVASLDCLTMRGEVAGGILP